MKLNSADVDVNKIVRALKNCGAEFSTNVNLNLHLKTKIADFMKKSTILVNEEQSI